jgi:hypothetical protein
VTESATAEQTRKLLLQSADTFFGEGMQRWVERGILFRLLKKFSHLETVVLY